MTGTRVNNPLKRGWLKFAGFVTVLAAVVALIADGTTILEKLMGMFRKPLIPCCPPPSPLPTSLSPSFPTSLPSLRPAEVHNSGTIRDMPDPKGFDFDAGQVLDQLDQPVEISGCGATSDLCVMSERSRIRVMAAPGAETKAACLEPPPADSEAFKGMYGLTTGSRICVTTNEGRIAMMILTRAPSVTDQTLNFRWITWE